MKTSRGLRIALFLAAVGGILVAAKALRLDRAALDFVEWVRGKGVAGAVLFGLAYAAATVAFLPGALLTLAAGFAYGPLVGTVIVSPASVTGATGAFLLGRTLARRWVADRVARNPRFAAIDRAVGQSGFRIVGLLRLSPVFPYNLLNYSLGLTRVRLRDFVLASFLGMLPGTVMYVYLGSLVTSASELFGGSREKTTGEWILYGAGLVATVVVTAIVTKIARRAIAQAVPAPEAQAS